MEQCYSFIQKKRMDQMSMKGTSVRYGKEQTFGEEWRKIVEIEDREKRNQEIDKLLENYQKNQQANGFWGQADPIQITFGIGTANAIQLDDKNLYYVFFDALRARLEYNKTAEKPLPEGKIVVNSIYATIDAYFGKFNGDLELRDRLTQFDFEKTNAASVASLKRRGCAACVEKAAVSHNLFLLTGRESYFVSSCSCKFEQSPDQGHSFTFIKNQKGNFMLYDHAMQNFGVVLGDPIETMLNGEPLVIGEPFANQGVYANALNMETELVAE